MSINHTYNKKRIFEKSVEAFKLHKFSRSDAQNYLDWIKLFLAYRDQANSGKLDQVAVKEFLRYLAEDKGLMPSRQQQAYMALNFFYNQVLKRSVWSAVDLGEEIAVNETPKASVQNIDNSPAWIKSLQEPYRLIAQLIHFSGLQLEEILNLRIDDIDLNSHAIRVKCLFGEVNEIQISDAVLSGLTLQVKKAYNMFQQDQRQGGVLFANPTATQKYRLSDNMRWYFLFPGTLKFNMNTQQRIREAMNPKSVEQAINVAKTQPAKKVELNQTQTTLNASLKA